MAQRYPLADQCVMFDDKTEKLRWFMLPSEAQDLLLGNSQKVKHSVPFDPVSYEGSRASPVPPLSPPRVTIASDVELRNSPVHFAVGGFVDPANLTPCYNQSEPDFSRNFLSLGHCNSLNSPTALSPIPSLAAIALSDRQRHCSCSSQTDLNSLDKENVPTNTPDPGNCSPTSQTPEYLQAYVKEVTKELATEIKSEIREVISQVQDVLDESGESDGPVERPRSSSLSLRSAQDVAEYLVEASQKLASEMKSELREVVSAVDVLIADEGGELKRSTTPPCLSAVSRSSAYLSSPEFSRRFFSRPRSASASSPSLLSPLTSPIDDTSPNQQTNESKFSSECESDETVIYVAPQKSEDSQTGDEELELDKDCPPVEIEKKRPTRSTVASISSQDSGINISFQEADTKLEPLVLNKSAKVACPLLRRRKVELDELQTVPQINARWHCPPRGIWKPAVEVRTFKIYTKLINSFIESYCKENTVDMV